MQMTKGSWFVVAMVGTILLGLYFVRATPANFDKRIGGQYQINSFLISKNEVDEARLTIGWVKATTKSLMPRIEVLDPRQTPIHRGEGLVTDLSLGEYVVAITFFDTELQESVREYLSLAGVSTEKAGENVLLEHVRVAHPPDDSMMIIYLGLSAKPTLETQQTRRELRLIIRNE